MITKNYIKMCKKAEEIQKEWEPKIGDIYFNQYYNDFNHIKEIEGIYDEEYYKHNYTHLPTQDKLQELLEKPLWWLIWHFEKFVEPMSDKECFKNKSMNELWLAFVMKEKYNKIWNGKIWIIK